MESNKLENGEDIQQFLSFSDEVNGAKQRILFKNLDKFYDHDDNIPDMGSNDIWPDSYLYMEKT